MSSQSTSLVSIVTPMYNNVEYVVECIESVRTQTYVRWDYVSVTIAVPTARRTSRALGAVRTTWVGDFIPLRAPRALPRRHRRRKLSHALDVGPGVFDSTVRTVQRVLVGEMRAELIMAVPTNRYSIEETFDMFDL
jgi:hypothetical protein